MKKTLIVEDDLTSRTLLREMLKRYGPVQEATNGKEAVDKVRQTLETGIPYDLICLDILMPEMDGYEALKEIRDLENAHGISPAERSVIFMITALGDVKNVVQAFSGCDAYLLKPIDGGKLLERLREFVLAG